VHADTIRTIEAYADVVVLRHFQVGGWVWLAPLVGRVVVLLHPFHGWLGGWLSGRVGWMGGHDEG